jgi:hypothetical protein
MLVAMLRVVATLASALSLTLVAAAAANTGGEGPIVLGAKQPFPSGIGWGTVHPRLIFNGGDPNGRAWNLRWSGWGTNVARAQGLTWIFRPQGGYYSKSGLIQLRAYGIGRCTANGKRAYTHLRARESVRPGGQFGSWFAWNGLATICHRS